MENRVEPSTRAGRYVKQLEGYQAFIPAPLPPDPPVRIDGELQSLLSTADIALGRLDGSIRTLPNPDLFVLMYVRKEAVLSSQIEGTQSSLQDVLEAEARVFTSTAQRDVAETINYIGAMNHGLQRLSDLPVSVRLIREIHSKLLQGVRGSRLTPGELRTSQNWIGPGGCTLHEATFVPPPPHEVPEALGKLETFLHDHGDLPVLVWIGLAHAQFESIHPFLDGNGRIGRMLIILLLCQQELLLKPVLYLSHFFKQHREQYYEALQSVRDTGNWEQWLIFFLRGVVEVSQQATDTARRILDLREEHRDLIATSLGRSAGNGYLALKHLYQHPIIAVKDVQRLIGTTYPAANNLIARMVECGIVQEFTGHARNRYFRYQRYIELFQTPEAHPTVMPSEGKEWVIQEDADRLDSESPDRPAHGLGSSGRSFPSRSDSGNCLR